MKELEFKKLKAHGDVLSFVSEARLVKDKTLVKTVKDVNSKLIIQLNDLHKPHGFFYLPS